MSTGGGKVSADNEFTRQQAAIAADQYGFWKENYRPLEQTAIGEIEGLRSQGAYDRAVGRAVADVGQSFSSARQQQQRMWQERGQTGTLGDLDSLRLSIGEATARALAANQARGNVYSQYMSGLQGMVNAGRAIPGQSAATFGDIGRMQFQAELQNAQAKQQRLGGFGSLLGTALGFAGMKYL
jgi:hypothetical protein